jgi:hypothetical protein
MEHDDESLKEAIYDIIAAARSSLRVSYAKPRPESGSTFDVRFTLNVDAKTGDLLRALAHKQACAAPKLVQRFITQCFAECLAVDEEVEVKAVA